MADFDKAIKYYDKFSEAYFYKAAVEQEVGNLSEAIQSLQTAKKYFEAGYREIHPYYQLPYQVELVDLEALENQLLLISNSEIEF